MDTSLPWLWDRGLLSSRQRETGKCFFSCLFVCWISLLCMGGGETGGRWVGAAQSHEDFRVGVIFHGGRGGTEINRVLMMMMMEAHGQVLKSFLCFRGQIKHFLKSLYVDFYVI